MKTLIEKILEVGDENCLFLVPIKPLNSVFGLFYYTSSEDPEFVVPMKIEYKSWYRTVNGYKIDLSPIYSGFEDKRFYISDLESMIETKEVEMFIKI
jgi:hypothetical protein